ncbi:MAG: 16S rRNA (adenine(1518)-N(6)/adenine(1519)-N(6))-dimethyltransferase RsmA [Alphaproteobacteria bacterium]|nr:16S rRNA (adenine(1518)-N(6)/adenine(1519)-N(6))-dimethyltransferase RsmA [Alphaproteobacteria bacterium]
MRAVEALPPLREVIAEAGLGARKGLGQHFLLDLNLTRRIARAADVPRGMPVIEIGPGPGGLTRALLLETDGPVLAIEKDPRCLPVLTALAEAAEGRVRLLEADALAVDETLALAESGMAIGDGAGRAALVANLPYNVGTPLLLKWLKAEPWPPWWASLTVMVQKEVALRLCAAPGTSDYGRLSVITAVRAKAVRLFDVPPRAFTPPPKVMSSIVRLTPRAEAPSGARLGALERVTAAAFGQRRKMLRSSLRAVFPEPEPVLARTGIPPQERAERVDPAGFLALAACLLPGDG